MSNLAPGQGVEPAVTVGVTARNSVEFIADTLEALRRQTFPDFEVVVADCASTDGTPELVRRYAELDPRFRLERSEQYVGINENHNRAVEHARGRYFCWLASDDVPAPSFLELLVQAHETDAGLVFVAPTTTAIDAEWRVDAPTPFLHYHDDDLRLDRPHAAARAAHLLRHLHECNAFSALWRIDRLRETGLLGHYPGADRVLLTKAVLVGRCRQIPDVVLYRRMHPAQVHHALRAGQVDRLFDRKLTALERRETLNTFRQQLLAVGQVEIPLGQKLASWAALTGIFLAIRAPRKLARTLLRPLRHRLRRR